MIFTDRIDAGNKLAAELENSGYPNPYIIALPRGGVPVAYEISKKLNAPLDVLVVRKLGIPAHPELGFGAIAPDHNIYINQEMALISGLSNTTVQQVISTEEQELQRRILKYRGNLTFPDLRQNTVILVDDGLATGVTARVAIKYLRQLHPAMLVLAVPVCAEDSVAAMRYLADDIVCLLSPPEFSAVGFWYYYFPQTTDGEVTTLLQKARGFKSKVNNPKHAPSSSSLNFTT